MADIVVQLSDPTPAITVGISVAPPISIGVAVTALPALSQLTDVNIPNPSDGQLLNFDSDTNKWIASDPDVVVPPPSNIDGGEFN